MSGGQRWKRVSWWVTWCVCMTFSRTLWMGVAVRNVWKEEEEREEGGRVPVTRAIIVELWRARTW